MLQLTLASPSEAMFKGFWRSREDARPDQACPSRSRPNQEEAASAPPDEAAAPTATLAFTTTSDSTQQGDAAPHSTLVRGTEGKSIEGRDIDDLHKRVDQGDPSAQYQLGCAYRTGNGVPKSNKKAIKWYLAAEKGGEEVLNADPEALNFLGVCYRKGKDVEQDDKKAVRYFKRASDLGCAPADFNLGVCYREGRGGLKSDLGEALRLFDLAAESEDQGVLNALNHAARLGYAEVREVLERRKGKNKANAGERAGEVVRKD